MCLFSSSVFVHLCGATRGETHVVCSIKCYPPYTYLLALLVLGQGSTAPDSVFLYYHWLSYYCGGKYSLALFTPVKDKQQSSVEGIIVQPGSGVV
jgi:hypothetical protein